MKLSGHCPLRNITKPCIYHIVAQKDPGVIVGTRKIISINHDSDAEEDVAGTSGADDDNDDDDDDDDGNDDDEVDVEVVENAADMVVPNRETQFLNIDVEE